MSRWSIREQETKNGPVLVKFGHYIPNEVAGGVQFIRLAQSRGWIAVHLEFQCQDGTTNISKVHYSPKHGTYNVHKPDTMTDVLFQGVVTNPLNPERKVVKNKVSLGSSRKVALRKLTAMIRNEELANHVMTLIDQCLEEKQAEWEAAA